jgi:hypothetical protein
MKKFFQVVWFLLPVLVVLTCAVFLFYVMIQIKTGQLRLR